MGWKMIQRVMDNFPGNGADRLAMLVLAYFADDKGTCYPSIRTIAEKMGNHRSNAQKTIAGLLKNKYLILLNDGKGGAARSSANHYRINFHAFTHRENATPTSSENAAGTHRENVATPVAKTSPDPSRKRDPNQVMNQKSESTPSGAPAKSDATASKSAAPMVLPDWIDINDWQAWLDHRKAVGAPMTKRAQELAIDDLTKLKAQGYDARDIIELSISKGWKGLFPPRDADSPTEWQQHLINLERSRKETREGLCGKRQEQFTGNTYDQAPTVNGKHLPANWRSSDQGITKAGNIMGLHARPGESFQQWGARIATEIGKARNHEPT